MHHQPTSPSTPPEKSTDAISAQTFEPTEIVIWTVDNMRARAIVIGVGSKPQTINIQVNAWGGDQKIDVPLSELSKMESHDATGPNAAEISVS
jgi:hypothetical protein